MGPETVQTGRENCDDCDEVINEFFLWGSCSLIENHDAPFTSGEDSLDDLKTETTQSVSVGNHNLEEISVDCGVQNGLKSFSFEVKT